MKQFLRFLLVTALLLPQRIEAPAQTSRTQVCMSREHRDVFSGTVGSRHIPSRDGCPVSVYVLSDKSRVLLYLYGGEPTELSYHISSED